MPGASQPILKNRPNPKDPPKLKASGSSQGGHQQQAQNPAPNNSAPKNPAPNNLAPAKSPHGVPPQAFDDYISSFVGDNPAITAHIVESAFDKLERSGVLADPTTEGHRVIKYGGLEGVDVSGSDLRDFYVQVERPDPSSPSGPSLMRLSDVILSGDHVKIAEIVGLLEFDGRTKFALGSTNERCHKILAQFSDKAQPSGQPSTDLTDLPTLSAPVWFTGYPSKEPKVDPGKIVSAQGLDRSLTNFPSTTDAIRALCVAGVLDKGLQAQITGIGRPEPVTAADWEERRRDFCEELATHFPPHMAKQAVDAPSWLVPMVRGLEMLASKEQSFLLQEIHRKQGNQGNNGTKNEAKEIAKRFGEFIDKGVDDETRCSMIAARSLIAYLHKRKAVNYPETDTRAAAAVLKTLGFWSAEANEQYLRAAPRGDFSPSVMEEARQVKSVVAVEGCRQDLRHLPTFTIDPSGSDDRDDAFSIEQVNQDGIAYRIHLHISDVASAIDSSSQLDKEAQRRGTTIYRPSGAITMLPEELPSDKLSLHAGVDRGAVTITFDVDQAGAVVGDPRFSTSVIQVKRNLTFDDADRLLSPDRANLSYKDEEVADLLSLAQQFGATKRQALQDQGGTRRISYDVNAVAASDGSGRYELAISPHGSGRSLVESLSHAYSCTAAELVEKHNRESHGDPVLGLFRAAERNPSLRGNRERHENLAVQHNRTAEETEVMKYLQVQGGMTMRAQLKTVPEVHQDIGSINLPSTSPLRDYSNLINQRQLLHIIDPAAYPNVSETIKNLGDAVADFRRGTDIQGSDKEQARRDMIESRPNGEPFAGIVVHREKAEKRGAIVKMITEVWIPELDQAYPLPVGFKNLSDLQNVRVSLTVSGKNIHVASVEPQ